MTHSWYTGEIVSIIPDDGLEWAVLEFTDMKAKADILSVPSNVLKAAGIAPLELGVNVCVLLNDDATREIDLHPQEYRPLS